jgi:hypothetical protein
VKGIAGLVTALAMMAGCNSPEPQEASLEVNFVLGMAGGNHCVEQPASNATCYSLRIQLISQSDKTLTFMSSEFIAHGSKTTATPFQEVSGLEPLQPGGAIEITILYEMSEAPVRVRGLAHGEDGGWFEVPVKISGLR